MEDLRNRKNRRGGCFFVRKKESQEGISKTYYWEPYRLNVHSDPCALPFLLVDEQSPAEFEAWNRISPLMNGWACRRTVDAESLLSNLSAHLQDGGGGDSFL